MSQDVKSLLLFRHYMDSVCFRERIPRIGGKNEYPGRVGRQCAGPGPKEKQHREVHWIYPTDGQKLVSLYFVLSFCLGKRISFPDIPNIIAFSNLAVHFLQPECKGVGLELWVKRGSFSFYFEYLKSDRLSKLPVFSGIHLLCFHCSCIESGKNCKY